LECVCLFFRHAPLGPDPTARAPGLASGPTTDILHHHRPGARRGVPRRNVGTPIHLADIPWDRGPRDRKVYLPSADPGSQSTYTTTCSGFTSPHRRARGPSRHPKALRPGRDRDPGPLADPARTQRTQTSGLPGWDPQMGPKTPRRCRCYCFPWGPSHGEIGFRSTDGQGLSKPAAQPTACVDVSST
jgi:hypothetical protein